MVITDVNQVTYIGDGITTAWPYTFRIIEATDIQIIVVEADGSETDITSDYYVDAENSTVYYPGYAPGAEPPEADQPPVLTADQRIIIYRALPATQTADLGEKWPFKVIENGLDKLTMLIQDWRDILGRCLKVRVSDTNFDATITPMAGRAIEINQSGDGFVCVDSPSTVLGQCEAIKVEVEANAEEVANNTQNVSVWTQTASNAADAAVQANNSAQGALVDAGALLDETRAYISAATVDSLWDEDATYEPGDVVMAENGAVYRCVQESTGDAPATSPAYWIPITTVELYAFEYDENGDLMPKINPAADANWSIDSNGDIMPTA